MNNRAAEELQPEDHGLVDGRYRLEAELGHGGMARVHRALDTRTGQRVALKKLTVSGDRDATLQAMFEREYHTLVQLAHPRIVRVFDYGVAAGRPYYTMELLEGADARNTIRDGRLSVQAVCVLLRDIASALALVHSRRMVHRDVSLRNVWCTPDGRAKLIDFGTLVASGPQTRVAGTPPFVPPEAVHAQPLDGRCDLFGLGAVAYFLLASRNAYPAREMGDLWKAWQRRPQPLADLRTDVPPALSDLVMALLSLDLRGRPASAAEVVDRLNAIGDLQAEDERHLAQAFLTTPKLVGRDAQIVQMHERLRDARRGRGNSVAIVAPAGLGRSRMLASVAVDAKLLGSAVVGVDAGAVAPGTLAVAGALAERLLDLLPLMAGRLLDTAGVLAHVSPALRTALGEPALDPLTPFERTRKVSSALVSMFEVTARHHRLTLLVDDLHRADGESLGVLAAIAVLARNKRMLLVTSCDEKALRDPSPVLAQIARAGGRIDLQPLAADHTRELMGSLFGDVPGLDEAASWLHELSGGSPQTCMQYAEYLVDRGLARYESGQWRLPQHLRSELLPATLGAMLEDRLATLGADARALALGLALARDETRSVWQPENRVRLEDFPKLLGFDPAADKATDTLALDHAARTFSALDELLSAGFVQQRDSQYVLGQHAIVDALLRTSDEHERKRAYERLAEVFAQPAYQVGLNAVRLLQRAGEHRRALEKAVAYADHVGGKGTMNWGAMRLSVDMQCYLEALKHWQAEGGRVRDALALRRQLVLVSAVYDWSVSRCGDEQLAQLRSDCGLVHWDDTDAAKPPLERLGVCFQRATEAFDRLPEAERGLAPLDAIRELVTCVLATMSATVNSHDVSRAKMLAQVLGPLRPLAPALAMSADLVGLHQDRVSGREMGERIRTDGIERLLATTELPETTRMGGAALNLHLLTIEDARRGRLRETDMMLLIVPFCGDEMFLVVHSRWLRHAFNGNAEQAKAYRKRVDMITEDDVWRRKATLFIEAELHALTGDLIELGRTCEGIEALAATFPGWRPWLHWAHAMQCKMRGEIADARTGLDAALALAPAGQHRAWTRIAPASAELRLLEGDAEAARREAEAALESVRALGLDRWAEVAAERVRALACSRLGDHDAAIAGIERALAIAAELEFGGLPQALLYEAHARIAIAARLPDKATESMTHLHRALERAAAPALIQAYEKLRGELRQQDQIELPGTMVTESATTHQREAAEVSTRVFTRLQALSERQERARQALALLLEETGAVSGHLFLYDTGGLYATASTSTAVSSAELLSRAQRHVEGEIARADMDDPTVVLSTDATAPSGPTDSDALVPVPLGNDLDGTLLGVALLLPAGAMRPPRPEFVRAISRCLQEAGDGVPLRIGVSRG